MKNRLYIFAVLLTFSLVVYSQKTNFYGERLRYNAKYGFIKGGEMLIESHLVSFKDTDCLDVKIDMYAIGLVNKLFNFHDVFRSIFSIENYKPYKFIRDAQEGSYKQYEVVSYYDNYVESTIKGRFQTNERFYDIVSGLFVLRAYDLGSVKVNQSLIFPIYFDENIFKAEIVYKGKTTIKVRGKKYRCHKFVPVFKDIKMFSKEGVTLYLEDTELKRPILINVAFRVGSFKIELVE